MSQPNKSILERLAVLETLMTNHLHHHEVWFKCVLLPVLVGVILNLLGFLWLAAKIVLEKL